jgi:hypothetical protein
MRALENRENQPPCSEAEYDLETLSISSFILSMVIDGSQSVLDYRSIPA